MEAQRGEKRPADTPVGGIDPQVGGGSVLAATTEVNAEHLDEEHPAVLETLEETDLSGVKSSDHPDNWSEERWHEESLKGKAKELASLERYQVYIPVPKQDTQGKKYITTR